MDLEELNREALRIAEQTLLLSPEEGDKYIRDEVAKAGLPQGVRVLLITQSTKYAEQKRLADAEHNQQLVEARQESELKKEGLKMQANQLKSDDRLKRWGFIAGAVGLATVLVLVFATQKLTPEQWFVCRVVLSLSAAGIAIPVAGFLHIKGNIGIVAVAATGGFAVFVLTYFYNPPSLSATAEPPAAVAPR